MIAALHPVNAMVMAYVSVTLARHALTMWSARTDVAAAPASVTLQPVS
jgi:hypothetical protein